MLPLIISIIAISIVIASCDNFNGPKPGTMPTSTGGGMTGGGTTGGGMMPPPAPPCDTANVSYASVVKPILDNNCVGCHSGSVPQGGANLSSVDNIARVVSRNRIFPRVLSGAGGASQMPPGARLSQCDIDKITAWVNQGARNN
ncbi:MAG: hypothetical protein EAZ92_02260 [Candidatus Kapaibacterium sp.]|nr:MAG: hypothetical protein EAZ92_02260 [Candidatus Kapabacteria bacterium]